MKAYRVVPIQPHQIHPAYLLLQPVVKDVDIYRWQHFCLKILGRHPNRSTETGGIWIAIDRLNYVRGLAVTWIRQHPLLGKVLNIPIFIVASAIDSEGVAADLLEHLKGLAADGDCDGLLIWSLADSSWDRVMHRCEFERLDHAVFMPANVSFPQ